MRFFKGATKKEWENWLRTATEEDFRLERIQLRKQKLEAIRKMREIQAELDKRLAENPPERGMVIRI